MVEVTRLESMGVPVVPATGNNIGFAQTKLLHPEDGRVLRDLKVSPGIYCNGALVKGAGGKEVDVRHLGSFIPRFVDKWVDTAAPPPHCADVCIGGLAKEKVVFMRPTELSDVGRRTATEFTTLMMIPEAGFEWMDPEAFVDAGETVLSLLILLPLNFPSSGLLEMQAWLHAVGLLLFDDATGRRSNGEGDGVVCKHVHVPGIGPEIDISPIGVNKGSAIARLLADAPGLLGAECGSDGSEVAVFGDAGNDVELFGMRRDKTGEALEPLGLDYRPTIRVAMPWANDVLLVADATEQCTCDVVMRRIADARAGTRKRPADEELSGSTAV